MNKNQYRYDLHILTQTPDSKDANGNIIPGVPGWVFYCKCRTERGKGEEYEATDGTMRKTSFLIQMPKGTAALAKGTQVRVFQDAQVRDECEVLYSTKDLFNTRAWV